MGVVVDHSPSGDIGGKLSLALSVEGLIEVILSLIEPVLPESDGPAAVPPHSKVADLSSMTCGLPAMLLAFAKQSAEQGGCYRALPLYCAAQHLYVMLAGRERRWGGGGGGGRIKGQSGYRHCVCWFQANFS